jgi:hypothetical protein
MAHNGVTPRKRVVIYMADLFSTRRFFAKAMKTDHRTFEKVMVPDGFLIVGPTKKLVPIYKVDTSTIELEKPSRT